MSASEDIDRLAGALHDLAKLYQFRSVDRRLYRSLTVSQSYCLRILCFQGPQKMSRLAGELGIRLSTMTGVVDQLESKGLVERATPREDRRSVQVALTVKGRKLYLQAHEAFLSHLAPVFDRRTPAERKKLLALFDDITGAVRTWMRHPQKATHHGEKHS